VRYLGAAGRIAYFRYKPVGGALEFYDGEGVPMRRALRRSPVAFHPVKALARNLLPPELESVGGRGGAVYRLAEGAPLVALADGVVRRIGRDEELGLVVEIAHDDGLVARYAHVGAVFGALQAGQRVRASQLVAVAGHSGRTPHDRLRLELWREQGGPEDPFVLTAKGDARPAVLGAPLEGEALARFREDVRAWGLALRKAG